MLEGKVTELDQAEADHAQEQLRTLLYCSWRAAVYENFDCLDQLIAEARRYRRKIDRMMERKENYDAAIEFATPEILREFEAGIFAAKGRF